MSSESQDAFAAATHMVPDLWAGATARSLLLEIHRAIGHQSGSMEELTRQVTEFGRTLHHHIEEEGGLASVVEALTQSSKERHELLHERLDRLEVHSNERRVQWGVLVLVWGGVCTLAGGVASLVVTLGQKSLWDAVAHALGLH